MSIAIDRFIDEITEKLYEQKFLFVCWEINFSHVELLVRDLDGNRVREVLDKRIIEQHSSRDFCEHVFDNVVRKFIDKKYDTPYEFDVKKRINKI